MQVERIRYQRKRGDTLVALQGRRIQITADWVLRARGKKMKNKANGPADCLGNVGPRSVDISSPGVSQETRRERTSWLPFDRSS